MVVSDVVKKSKNIENLGNLLCSPFDPVLLGVELVEYADLDVDGNAPNARELGAQPLVQQEFPEKSIWDSECKVTWIGDQRGT